MLNQVDSSHSDLSLSLAEKKIIMNEVIKPDNAIANVFHQFLKDG